MSNKKTNISYNQQYSKLSCKLTRDITKEDKKTQGIYFTPPKTIQTNLKRLESYMDNIKNVLEPSCGSCEYILALNKKYPHLNITGIENNKTIYKKIKDFDKKENITIINKDFLKYNHETTYGLIIGNPPYFVMKKKEVDKSLYEYFDGRPNIFILFIIKSLQLLRNNGILSFVLPKNFLNCLYYDKTRKYINENFKILDILECQDKYIETKQDTIIIIIQKKKKKMNKKYVLKRHNYLIFGTSDNIKELKKLYTDSKSLSELDFEVKVGNIVWNQCKYFLTDDNTKIRLIYNSDIVNKKLTLKEYTNNNKKNFIDINKIDKNKIQYIIKKIHTSPILVVNRGYGVGKYKFEYCLINVDFKYFIENHLIYIKYKKNITNSKLIKLYNKIINSFHNQKTIDFIKLYFGNNAINITELNYIFPIYNI